VMKPPRKGMTHIFTIFMRRWFPSWNKCAFFVGEYINMFCGWFLLINNWSNLKVS
jgi:hypothetical protein